MVRAVLITGLLAAVLSLVGTSPVAACSPPEEDFKPRVRYLANEPVAADLTEILEAPGSFAVERVMEAHTAPAWFHHVAGAFVIRQSWGPAPETFAPERDGSDRRLRGDCTFSYDAASLGQSDLLVYGSDEYVLLYGDDPRAFLDEFYGPGEAVAVDSVALAAMMDDLERPAVLRFGAWAEQNVLALAFVGLLGLFVVVRRRRIRVASSVEVA